MANAEKYERTEARKDTRAGYYYERGLETRVGKVKVKMPRLRHLPLETAIIEHSRLNQKVYAHIETWRNRPLKEQYSYVYLDGICLKRDWGGSYENVSIFSGKT
ncbi:MAG: transposase [Bacillota bacterium]